MSATQPSVPAVAAAASDFGEGPDPTDEPDEEKQGAVRVSPVARLYRHALESVFGFLDLADLSRVLSVSRSWSSAVRSMKSIGATLVKPRSYSLVAASPLARHVGQFGSDSSRWPELTSNDLFLLSHHLGSLTDLACSVQLLQPSRLYFGPSLQTLQLELKADAGNAAAINDAIVTISQLPQLTDLTLQLPSFFSALCFAPLKAASKLHDLKVEAADWPQPTSEHLDQLRMLPHLRKMAIERLSSTNLAYMLRGPHSMQWQKIHSVYPVDDVSGAALSSLPTLTELRAFQCFSVAFLPSLTRLRSLDLHLAKSVHAGAIATAIATGLSHCAQITKLTLRAADVTSQHMRQVLSHLPLLRSLALHDCSALDSLSFFSECAHLAQSLQSLKMSDCTNAALHSTDLKHILTLKSLMSLELTRTFVERLDPDTRALLTPPSVVLAKLERFVYVQNFSDLCQLKMKH